MNHLTRLLVALPLGCMAACSGSLFQSKAAAPTIYVLSPSAPSSSLGSSAAIPADLAVLKPRLRTGLESDRIAVLYPDRRLDYFADARWSGALGDMLQDLAVQEIHCACAFAHGQRRCLGVRERLLAGNRSDGFSSRVRIGVAAADRARAPAGPPRRFGRSAHSRPIRSGCAAAGGGKSVERHCRCLCARGGHGVRRDCSARGGQFGRCFRSSIGRWPPQSGSASSPRPMHRPCRMRPPPRPRSWRNSRPPRGRSRRAPACAVPRPPRD